MKPALLIALLVLVGGAIAAFSVLGDRADQRLADAFDEPCPDPGNPFVPLPEGYSYRSRPGPAGEVRGEGREIRRGATRVGAVFAYSSADAKVLPDAFADSYDEGMERSERADVIVLSRGPERMLVGARECHVITLMTVPEHERRLERAFFG